MEIDKTFKPNEEWMAKKYNEMNQQLFGGSLGDCDFAIFTSGKGSQGGVLGWFKITGSNVRADRYSRRMFVGGWGTKVFIDRNNFVRLCRPRIELNGNYTGTEQSFLATLAHEMCHYYTYMNGYCPKQGHGREFKEIGQIVSQRSNGMFTIQRLASAEQMSEMELSDEMKAKREKRLSNRKSSVTAVIVFTPEGKIKLSITSNERLVNLIKTTSEGHGEKVIVTNNADVIDYLFAKGYKKNMRTWRYWSLEGKPWIDELKQMLPETSGETLGVKRLTVQPQPKQSKRVFSIKTSNGVFEYDANSYYALLNALKERFPRTSEDAILKLINNPNNYRMVESKMNTKSIIKEVIDEFMKNEFRGANNMNNAVEITPDMNLGLESPLEMD